MFSSVPRDPAYKRFYHITAVKQLLCRQKRRSAPFAVQYKHQILRHFRVVFFKLFKRNIYRVLYMSLLVFLFPRTSMISILLLYIYLSISLGEIVSNLNTRLPPFNTNNVLYSFRFCPVTGKFPSFSPAAERGKNDKGRIYYPPRVQITCSSSTYRCCC